LFIQENIHLPIATVIDMIILSLSKLFVVSVFHWITRAALAMSPQGQPWWGVELKIENYLRITGLAAEEYGAVGGVKLLVHRAMPLEMRISVFHAYYFLVLGHPHVFLP
jgi:hypothetical protein